MRLLYLSLLLLALAPGFADHVAGRETLPVEECLGTLGYTLYAKPYAGDAYLAPADPAALAAWIGAGGS